MEFDNITMEDKIGEEYTEHKVFEELKIYSDFYQSLSFFVTGWAIKGVKTTSNFNFDFYSSMEGTVDSICEILGKGRINDAYALIRKYFDSTFINIYTSLYLRDNFSADNFIVKEIDDWKEGTGKILGYKMISEYIKKSPKLKPINDLLKKDDRYKKLRNMCNENIHYNFYHNFRLNDNKIQYYNRIKHLDAISSGMRALFIQHFAYIFYINEHYFISSDCIGWHSAGITSEEDSQYWAEPFIQKIFSEIIEKHRPNIAKEIKEKTKIKLE